MSFWTKLFGRSVSTKPASTLQDFYARRNDTARELLSNGAYRQALHQSLARLEAAGLRIMPSLDRDLIALRFFIDLAENWSDELETFFDDGEMGESNSPDLKVFWILSSESADLTAFEGINDALSTAAPSSEDTSNLLTAYSSSVFENAASMWTVNEEEPDSYVGDRVSQLLDLTDGDLQGTSTVDICASGDLVGTVMLSDGTSETFHLTSDKRPDTTPLFKAMNALAARSGKGRFIVVVDGSSDSLTPVYLRSGEQAAFRKWAERQYCVGGPAPIDWIE